MILLFEPIYIFLFFNKSLTYTLLYFSSIHILYALLAVYSGKLISKIGVSNCILLGNIFLFGYYLTLYYLNYNHWLIFLAVILGSLSKALFWPGFHLDFVRFSHRKERSEEVGKLKALNILPIIISPILGGWIVTTKGYSFLFSIALIILILSTLPLFIARHKKEKYEESYPVTWKRVLSPKFNSRTLAFGAAGIETGTARYLWPIFLYLLAISPFNIGGISSFSLGLSALFSLYLGKKLKAKASQEKILKLGSKLVALMWIIKSLAQDTFQALITRASYRVLGNLVAIPFSTIFYNLADSRHEEADEFIIYREIVLNASRGLFFAILAVIFAFTDKIIIAFWLTSLACLALPNVAKSK